MADDYIRMACAEVKYMTKPSPSGEQAINRTLLVVGGGVTGMTAAIEAAKAGYPVHLVAEEAKLGGVWADLYKRMPFRAAAAGVSNARNADLPKPEDPGIEAIAAERMSKVGDTLQSLNLEPERVAVYEVAITDIKRAPQLINDMAETVEKIGMSPFKF
jgi:heterodisulfide reductase subunit A-like polyferredoxin